MTPRVIPSDSARALWLLILGTALARLVLAAVLGLSFDESYTVAIGQQLSWSYFDHPPLHIWLAGIWSRLVAGDDPSLLRLPFITLFAGSTWLLYWITTESYGERAGLWAAVWFNLAPLYGVGIGSFVLPDGPLVFFSLLAVAAMIRALRARSRSWREYAWWSVAGLAGGFALLSKYLAVFLFLGAVLFLLTSRWRVLASPGPWLAALMALGCFTPVILWNAAHGWASFVFQGGRVRSEGFSASRLFLDLAGQAAYLFPWVALGLVWALGRALRRGRRDAVGWLFSCIAIGPIAFFALLPLWAVTLPHWPSVGWLFAFPLLGEALAAGVWSHKRLMLVATYATAGALLTLLALLSSQTKTGWISRRAPGFAAVDPTIDFFDWRYVGPAMAARRATLVATVSWMDAAKIDQALGGEVSVLCLSGDCRQFAFSQDLRRFAGCDAIVLADARRGNWRTLAAPYFEELEPLPPIVLRRAGEAVLTLQVAHGIGFERRVGAAC